MRRWIAEHIAFPLQDRINKTSVLATRDFLLESQHWQAEKLEKYRLKKLEALIHHAYENVPYYRSLFTRNSLKPADIRTFADLEKIPVLTKETARQEAKSLCDVNLKGYHTVAGATGGTSGVPLPVYWDAAELSMSWGAYYRWYAWLGLEPWDPMTVLWGARTVVKKTRKQALKSQFKDFYYNRKTINTFRLGDEQIPALVKHLETFRPKILRGYLSSLIRVAGYLREKNIQMHYQPEFISPTTETLLPDYRLLLENVFRAPVYDQYGCGESNSIAFECPVHKGMHLNMEHIHLENNGSRAIQPVIFTNLDNFAMPFIRYQNGDEVEFSDESCTCGVNQPLLKRIVGRSADGIYLKNGSKVHGVFFTDILRELYGDFTMNIRRFQVYQYKNRHAEFRYEPFPSFSDKDKARLLETLKGFLDDVVLVEMKELPLDASGKFRYVITEL
jgi:phenylacetate-CoA ligase